MELRLTGYKHLRFRLSLCNLPGLVSPQRTIFFFGKINPNISLGETRENCVTHIFSGSKELTVEGKVTPT